jgi:hypothetical protein
VQSPIISLTKSSPAVQAGFLAAGMTVFCIALLQSIAVVLAWVASGGL